MKKFVVFIMLSAILLFNISARQVVKSYLTFDVKSCKSIDVSSSINEMVNFGWKVKSITPVEGHNPTIYSGNNPTMYVIVVFEDN